MRGSYLHNTLLVAPIAALLRRAGAEVRLEYPGGRGRKAGYVDLFAEWDNWRIVCEAELLTKRIPHDIAKAVTLQADLLLIVVPDGRRARVAQQAVWRARALVRSEGLTIWTLAPGPALRRLEHFEHFMTRTNVRKSFSQETLEPTASSSDVAICSRKAP
jgi:hypothetical protein